MVTRLERTTRVNTVIDEAFRDRWFKWMVGHADKVNWSVFTYHEYITPEFILANPEYPWDLSYMSLNPNLTMDFVNRHPEIPWNWLYVSKLKLTMKDINENMDKPWDWKILSGNPCITLSDITENPDKPWNWDGISVNPNLTVEFIKANQDKPWYMIGLQFNFNLIGVVPPVNSVESVVSYLESPFYDIVLRKRIINKNMLDLDIIPMKAIDMWDFLSAYCTIDVITNNIDKPWNWNKIAQQNPNLTLDFVKLNQDRLYNDLILINDNVSLDIIQYIINLCYLESCKHSINALNPWSINVINPWSRISCNNNLTAEFIDKYATMPLSWNSIIRRVNNLTFDFVDRYIDKSLNWDHISKSLFETERTNHRLAEYRRYLAAYRIQQWWHRLRLDPRHPVGQRRLEREYAELFGPEAL